ncbi:PH domain-containing protein [Blastococcus mobilis]|uniref:Putative membrane protein n=1 Tax=Blastococcus mobilis TaxID=1938746 RepID=A0A238WLR4_9ACTN|nr:PH domain-containing protein [Blastococcus mobilis]SNR47368.1 putative membrane protein [Blastococcus mobilis]
MTPPPAIGRRTSPRIVLVHTATFRQARQFVPAIIPVVAATGLGGGTITVVALVIGVTLLSLATAAISWWRFTYLDGPAAVVVTRGLLSRSVRTVPNDRIRGVEVEAGPLHRLFGLVRVRIDAAAGSADKDEELVIDGVSRAEGDRLRVAVLTHRSTPPPAEHGEPESDELFARFDNRWLLYAPLVGSYLAVPLAGVGALLRLAQELPERFRPDVDGVEISGLQMLLAVLGLSLVLLLGGSIIGAAVVNWGFRLTRQRGSLVATRGLVTRRHTELEIDRIRGWTLSEGLGMRWVRAARVSALVTGLGDAARRGQLLPMGPRDEGRALGVRLVPDPGPLLRHPRAARRRQIVRALVSGAVVTTAGAVVTLLLGSWWVLAAGLTMLVLGVPIGLGRYAALGHAAGGTSFAVRSGWVVREEAVLQRRAVVGWQVRQSPFQRRAGLATVLACVGAGRGGYAAVDMAAAEVARFTAAASDDWAATFTARAG